MPLSSTSDDSAAAGDSTATGGRTSGERSAGQKSGGQHHTSSGPARPADGGTSSAHGGTDGTAKGKTVQVAPPKPQGELVAPAAGRERYKQLFNG